MNAPRRPSSGSLHSDDSPSYSLFAASPFATRSAIGLPQCESPSLLALLDSPVVNEFSHQTIDPSTDPSIEEFLLDRMPRISLTPTRSRSTSLSPIKSSIHQSVSQPSILALTQQSINQSNNQTAPSSQSSNQATRPSSPASSGADTNSIKVDFYKTELCRNFKVNGSCQYGKKCKYAHGENEMRDRRRAANYRTKPCVDAARAGVLRCCYASRCNFLHPGNAVRHVLTPSEAAINQANNQTISGVVMDVWDSEMRYMDEDYDEAVEKQYNVKYPFGMFM